MPLQVHVDSISGPTPELTVDLEGGGISLERHVHKGCGQHPPSGWCHSQKGHLLRQLQRELVLRKHGRRMSPRMHVHVLNHMVVDFKPRTRPGHAKTGLSSMNRCQGEGSVTEPSRTLNPATLLNPYFQAKIPSVPKPSISNSESHNPLKPFFTEVASRYLSSASRLSSVVPRTVPCRPEEPSPAPWMVALDLTLLSLKFMVQGLRWARYKKDM